MGWTWHNYEEAWKRRRSGADHKRLWRDCDLVKNDDASFSVYWAYKAYDGYDAKTSKNKYIKTDRKPLAHITTDNVLTMLLDPIHCDQTSMRRLTYAVNTYVYRDSSHCRTRVHKIRVSGQKGWGKGTMPWCPTTPEKSIPYTVGMQFKLDNTGYPVELLKSQPDIRLRVKKDAAQKAKADTKIMGILLRSMIRLGEFDHYINDAMSRGYSHTQSTDFDINYKEPTGDDARQVFLYGFNRTQVPAMSMYRNSTWTKVTENERRTMYIDRIVDNGMTALRRHIYETTGGLEEVV